MDNQQEELEKIEKMMTKTDFWQKGQEEISKLNQHGAYLREQIDQWHRYYSEIEDAKILAEIAHEEDDQSTLEDVDLDPLGFLVIFASGKNRADPGGELHTSFRISGAGEYLALLNPSGEAAGSGLRSPMKPLYLRAGSAS